ncbi:uncharacterized protein LOC119072866 [Bradysia coprophila]|uniref:uncharacterized protein LOC119072866 n=1 Tax=Bradysia coprophila TaxID=38358 RepID=UPI00187D7DFD|nr:uncharacterized protein LOC119072866 [Bradysia coprophila]
MALNVALPLSGLSELMYDRCALLSPIGQDFEDNLELLVTPYGSSESSESGIGSNESKNTKSVSEDDETPSTPSASPPSSPASPMLEKELTAETPAAVDEMVEVKIGYAGRDILDLAKNLTDSSWKFQYADLPNNNVTMFMQNRSQYHRLGADGLNCEYDLATCAECTFQFPVMSNDKAQPKMPSIKMYKHF